MPGGADLDPLPNPYPPSPFGYGKAPAFVAGALWRLWLFLRVELDVGDC